MTEPREPEAGRDDADARDVDDERQATLTVVRRRPSRRAWVALTAAAGLLVVAAVGGARWWDREPTITGTPKPTQSLTDSVPTPTSWNPPVGAWTLTAPAPVGPRYDALSFHADGRYYILGGYTGLTSEVLNNDWDLHGEPVFDGASYDPATNSWTPLRSFEGVFPWVTTSSAAVVVDGRLFVVSPLGAPLHVYNGQPAATGDRVAASLDLRAGGEWTVLPAPPATSARADQVLMPADDGLFLFADRGASGATDYVYEFSTGAWASLPPPPQESLDSRRVSVLDATHVLLETSPTFEKGGRETPGGYAIFDLTTRAWRATNLPYAGEGPTHTVDGVAVLETWGPREDSPPAVATCRFAGVGGATRDACTLSELSWEEAAVTGGLAARHDNMGGDIANRPLSAASAVEVHHKLFSPRTNVLWRVPPLPGVHYAEHSTDGGLDGAVMAAGADSVLSCFGYADKPEEHTLVNQEKCYLLQIPDPLPGHPLR